MTEFGMVTQLGERTFLGVTLPELIGLPLTAYGLLQYGCVQKFSLKLTRF